MIRSGPPAGPFNFFVTLVPDQDNFVALGSKPFRLVVDLGHERARCIDGPEVARCGFLMDGGRNTVCAEYDQRTFGDLISFLNKYCAAILECLHNISVVNDLFAYVDGAPYKSSAFSTVTTALSTPAQ